jgi:hypothetical protein
MDTEKIWRAIEYMTDSKNAALICSKADPNPINRKEALKYYEVLQTALACMEKQVPKAVIVKPLLVDNTIMAPTCYICGSVVCDDQFYCHNCGQLLLQESEADHDHL